MEQTLVKDFLKLLRDDVHVTVVVETCQKAIYYGTVTDVPATIGYMCVVAQCFETDCDEPMVALLVK